MTVFKFRNEGVVVTCGVFPKEGGGYIVTLLTNRVGVFTETNDLVTTLDRFCLEVCHVSFLAGLRFRKWIEQVK